MKRHLKRFLIPSIWITVFYTATCLLAEDAEMACERLSGELADEVNRVSEKLKQLAPEQRIAEIERLQKDQQAKQQILRQLKREQLSEANVLLPNSALATELDRVNDAIRKEIRSVTEPRISSEEHVRQVDVAIEKTVALQDRCRTILREGAVNEGVTAQKSPIATDDEPSAKGREILDQVKSMTPEERIVAIDTRRVQIAGFESGVRIKNESDPNSKNNGR